MYLPLEKQKPCINVLSHWENRTYRLYNSNMLDNIAVLFVCTVYTHTHTHHWSDLTKPCNFTSSQCDAPFIRTQHRSPDAALILRSPIYKHRKKQQ